MFGYVVVFGMTVQAVIALIWGLTGRQSVSLPTPILSLLFFVMLFLGLIMGVKAVSLVKIQPLLEEWSVQEEENVGEEKQ